MMDGRFGYLLFGAINEDGSSYDAPSNWGAFGSRLFSRLDRYGVITQQDLVMIQMWLVAPAKLDGDVVDELQEGFVLTRDIVAKAMAAAQSAELK